MCMRDLFLLLPQNALSLCGSSNLASHNCLKSANVYFFVIVLVVIHKYYKSACMTVDLDVVGCIGRTVCAIVHLVTWFFFVVKLSFVLF